MKRLPLVVSFVLFIALCASAAYWAMQLFTPPVRPVAAPPRVAKAEIKPEAAAALFGGGRSKVAVASNFQLRGVVVSDNGEESVAILSADGKPAQAIRVDKEVMPGVTIKEVHRDHVLLSEGGVTKRVELPESEKGQADVATMSPVETSPGRQPAPALTSRPPPVVAPPPATAVTPQTGPPGMASGTMPAQATQQAPPVVAPQAVNPRSAAMGAMPPPGVNPGPQAPNVATNPPPNPEPMAPAAPAMSGGAPVPGGMPPPPDYMSGR